MRAEDLAINGGAQRQRLHAIVTKEHSGGREH